MKHRSHTHSVLRSPGPECSRPSPPARRSDVLPCERIVARATPAMRAGADADVVEVLSTGPLALALGVGASSSVSMSGYGEKYLRRARVGDRTHI